MEDIEESVGHLVESERGNEKYESTSRAAHFDVIFIR